MCGGNWPPRPAGNEGDLEARLAPTPPSQRPDGGVGANLEAWSERRRGGVASLEERRTGTRGFSRRNQERLESRGVMDGKREKKKRDKRNTTRRTNRKKARRPSM